MLALLLVLGLAFRALVRRIRAADQILNDASCGGCRSVELGKPPLGGGWLEPTSRPRLCRREQTGVRV